MPWELWSLVLPQSWSHPEARAQASAFELSAAAHLGGGESGCAKGSADGTRGRETV